LLNNFSEINFVLDTLTPHEHVQECLKLNHLFNDTLTSRGASSSTISDVLGDEP